MNIFQNFKLLKLDMEENGWVIEAFPFAYKDTDYIVLVKLYQKGDIKKDKYALLEVEFLKKNDIYDNLIVQANTCKLMTDARTLREYFGLKWSNNIGDILRQFSEQFAKFIPSKVNPSKTEGLQVAMVKSLSESDSKDPSKIYCYSVRRNSGGGTRSAFNDNKSRLLRPNLHSKFKDDQSVSFYYSLERAREKTDAQIINIFSNK